MSILLLEFIMLCAIGYGCWWLGRRSSQVEPVERRSPAIDEIQQVQETVEGLLLVLEKKAAEIEVRLQERFDQLANLEDKAAKLTTSSARPVEQLQPNLELRATAAPDPAPKIYTSNSSSSFERALSLIDEGNDLHDVARATGLTVAEIETAARMQELRTGQQRTTTE